MRRKGSWEGKRKVGSEGSEKVAGGRDKNKIYFLLLAPATGVLKLDIGCSRLIQGGPT